MWLTEKKRTAINNHASRATNCLQTFFPFDLCVLLINNSMSRHLPLVLWSRALRPTLSLRLVPRGFSSEGDPPSVDDVIGDFVNRKWKKKSNVDAAAQVWPTDRALNDAVAPAQELQGHWESLERRVTGRRPRSDRPSGRVNLRKVRVVAL